MFWCEPKDVTKADSASRLLRRKTFATTVPSQVKKARRPSQKKKKKLPINLSVRSTIASHSTVCAILCIVDKFKKLYIEKRNISYCA